MSPLDASLRLNVVLEGAVDPRRQVRDVMGLEHQLVERQTERGREEGGRGREREGKFEMQMLLYDAECKRRELVIVTVTTAT